MSRDLKLSSSTSPQSFKSLLGGRPVRAETRRCAKHPSRFAQIHEKKYYEKYQGSGKKIILIGAAFDKTTRNLDDWLVEELKIEK